MRRMKQVAPVLIASLFFFVADTFADKPPVSISTMTPNRARMAPLGRLANVMLVVRMEVHQDNRSLDVNCEGLDGGNWPSSGKDFGEGEKHQKEIYDIGFFLPPAIYRCEAVLKRKQEDGKMREFKNSLELKVR